MSRRNQSMRRWSVNTAIRKSSCGRVRESPASRSRDGRDGMRNDEPLIANEVRTAAYEIIRRKGATNHAIGLVTARLLESIVRDEHRVLTVSRIQNGTLGIRDVALSLPTIVGANGGAEVVEPDLSDEERHALERSTGVLRAAISSIDAG